MYNVSWRDRKYASVHRIQAILFGGEQIKIIVFGLLLVTACHSAPSTVAKVDSSNRQQTQRDTMQPAVHSANSPLPDPRGSTFRYFIVDLNNDGAADTITLALLPSDSNYYTAVAIAIKGYGRWLFQVSDTTKSWTDYDDWFEDSSANAVQTRKFFLRKGANYALLLLFGYVGETGGRQGFTIIKIENNQARQVLDQVSQHLDLENILSLSDLDKDGRFELVCSFTFECSGPDTLGGLIGPYSPYYVYTIGDTCVLNKRLMRKYNEENYVFAGYEFTDGIKVLYPNDRSQKPRLLKPK